MPNFIKRYIHLNLLLFKSSEQWPVKLKINQKMIII